MPKRIVDGEKLWTSDKIRQVKPVSFRAEYANLIPLALANGSFECNPERVHAIVYATNRDDWSRKKVANLLNELQRVGLLFRWIDADTGKQWGYFVGIEKPGRLPARSEVLGKRYEIGVDPPKEALAAFLRGERIAPTSRYPRDSISAGTGIGIGLGSGIGEGVGEGEGGGESGGNDAPAPALLSAPSSGVSACADTEKHGHVKSVIGAAEAEAKPGKPTPPHSFTGIHLSVFSRSSEIQPGATP